MPDHGTSSGVDAGSLIDGASALASLVAFGGATYLLSQSIALAAVLGLLTAAGTYFVLPWTRAIATSNGDPAADAGDATVEQERSGSTATGGREVHRGAAGLALDGGAIVGLVAWFVLEEPLIAAAVALGVVLVEYPLLSTVLPDPEA